MRLSDRDKAMLDGGDGDAARMAMAALVELGEAFDAPDMVDIGYAHVHAGMAMYLGDVELIEDLADQGARMAVPASTNIANADMGNWRDTGAPEPLVRLQERAQSAHRKMGSSGCFTCTPYWAGHWPTWNMHVASIESGVTIFSNSVLGARANRDGYFATYAGITGRYPRFGLHVTENRRPTHRVEIEADVAGTSDFTALGYAIGEAVPNGVPYLSGLANRPSLDELDALGVGMATSGGVAMFILPGVTPPSDNEPKYETSALPSATVNTDALRSVYERFSNGDPGSVDVVHIGCPHASFEEMKSYARLLAGRTVRPDLEVWITTNRHVRQMAKDAGFLTPIVASGARVISDTCPISCHFARTCSPDPKLGVNPPTIRTTVVDSAKQAHYVRDMIHCHTLFTTTENAVEMATTGIYVPRF